MTTSLILAAALLSQSPAARPEAEPRARVMVLGVYHFESPNLDMVKSERVDHLSEAKQEEIADVLDRLAEFQPTKIVLEATPDATSVQRSYEAYLRDEHELAGDEREQLGFRLARQFGHARVVLADHASGMDFGAVMAAAEKDKDQRFLGWFGSAMVEAQALMDRQAKLSVRDALLMLNEPALQERTRGLYLQLARVRGDDYAGAKVAAEWYRRNFCIFANVCSAIESSGERVLVIFGQGHAPYLRELVRSSPDLELVEPNEYLR